MSESHEQFHRRVRVRLPIADRYLGDARAAAGAARDLAASFHRPLLRIPISTEPLPGGTRTVQTGTAP